MKNLLVLGILATGIAHADVSEFSKIKRIDCVRRDNAQFTLTIYPQVFKKEGRIYTALSESRTSNAAYFYETTFSEKNGQAVIDLKNITYQFEHDRS